MVCRRSIHVIECSTVRRKIVDNLSHVLCPIVDRLGMRLQDQNSAGFIQSGPQALQ